MRERLRRWGFLVGCFGSLLAVALPNLSAQSLTSLLHTRRTARNVTTAIHEPGALRPAATLRAERVFVERQKRGLFRVALLPKLVLERASLDLLDANAAATCIRRLIGSFQTDGRLQPVEFRGLTITRAGSSGWTLTAALARPTSSSAWTLENVTWQKGAENVISLSSARLLVLSSGRTVLSDPSGVAVEMEVAP